MALEAPASRPAAGVSQTHEPPGSPKPPAPRSGPDAGPNADAPKATRVLSAQVGMGRRITEIWRSRELLVNLVWTEIRVKYKNSFLGLLWSMLSPALTLVVFSVVFGVFLNNHIPYYVIFLFSGLLIWNFFSTGVITATGVVVNNAGLVKKVAFPREILALAALGSAGVFFFFQACVMALFMVGFTNPPDWTLIWLIPVALLPVTVLGAGLALLLASVNVYLRDTQHLVEVIVGAAWFWACPIVYSFQNTIAPKFEAHHIPQWLFFLNPMTPPVMTFQRVLYNHMGWVKTTIPHAKGTPPVKLQFLPPWGPWHYVMLDGIVLAVALVLAYVGMVVFGRLAGNFAEEL